MKIEIVSPPKQIPNIGDFFRFKNGNRIFLRINPIPHHPREGTGITCVDLTHLCNVTILHKDLASIELLKLVGNELKLETV